MATLPKCQRALLCMFVESTLTPTEINSCLKWGEPEIV